MRDGLGVSHAHSLSHVRVLEEECGFAAHDASLETKHTRCNTVTQDAGAGSEAGEAREVPLACFACIIFGCFFSTFS